MGTNTNNIKDFEVFRKVMTNNLADWESGKRKPGKTDSYAGIWKEMNSSRFFMENEHNDMMAELERLASLYNPAIIAKERNRFNGDYEKLTAVISSAFRRLCLFVQQA